MRILILGAGDAGQNLAMRVSQEKHDIVIVDNQPGPLQEIQQQLDIQTVLGDAASPRTLSEAGLANADLVVAVTDSDETNILACAFADRAGVRHKVARVSNPDFITGSEAFDIRSVGINLVISQKEECARELYNILRMPGTLEFADLFDGRAFAVGIRVHMDSPLMMTQLKNFPKPEMLTGIRFIAILRGDELLLPRGETQFMIGDDIYFIGQPDDVKAFIEWACPEHANFAKIVIAGGGDIGLHLARLLETSPSQTVLVERDAQRAEECSRLLGKTLVIRGDALEQETVDNIGIVSGTAFVALTGSDENNIIICLLGEKEGANFTLAHVSKPEYVPIINNLSLLDRAVSAHTSMINAILHFIRGRNVKAATLLHRLPGELLEIVLPANSRWAKKAVKDLRIPDGVTIGAILREGEVKAATGDLVLQPGDRLVVFALPKAVGKIEALVKK
jgi:trk system potassium uptake protein TrkA